MTCSIKVVYAEHGSVTIPCSDLQSAEYFAFEYAKTHADAEFVEIYEGKECIGLIRPEDALKADPAVHIGEYETQRDLRLKEKLDHALMVRRDMLEMLKRLESRRAPT